MLFTELFHSRNPWWLAPTARLATEHPKRRTAFDVLWAAAAGPATGRACLLLGPRQVGKTVLLEQVADALLDADCAPAQLMYFDFSDERLATPTALREIVDFEPPGLRVDQARIYLLDEISRSPNWSDALKQAVDRSRRRPERARHRFIVTDSASSALRTGARDSLQGRVDEPRILGLSFAEFVSLQTRDGEGADDAHARLPNAAERYLSIGGFPEHLFASSYENVRRRIREDICDRAIGRDFSRRGIDTDRVQSLFVALVQDSGGIFEATKRARDIDGGLAASGTDVRTVQAWLRLLEDGCLVSVLHPRRAAQQDGRMRGTQQLRARPRVYPSDHGMVPAFAPFLDPMSRPDVRGKVLEAAVLRHLRGVRDARGDFELSFYREGEQHDLDFVIDFHDRSLGIETTMSRDPRKDLAKKGAAAVRARVDALAIVHGGSEDTRVDKIRLVPFGKFLRDPEGFIYEATK